MSIAYNYSGKHQDLATLLRRFQLGDLLHSISKYSADLMKSHNSESPKEASWEKYHVLNGSTRGIEEKNTLVTGWNLIDLAYYEGSGTSVQIENNGESGIQVTYGENLTELLVTDKTSTLGLYTKLESATCEGDAVTFSIGTYRMVDGAEQQVGSSRTVCVRSTVQTPAS